MAVNVRIEGGTGEKVQARMAALATMYDDLSEPLGQVGEMLREHILAGFTAEGSPVPWPELSDTPPYFYRSWKEAAFPGKPILQLTGALRTAAAGLDGPGESGNISEVAGKEGRFGVKLSHPVPDHTGEMTTLEYAAKHQYGDGVPVRAWWQMTDEVKQRATSIVRHWILETAKGTGP